MALLTYLQAGENFPPTYRALTCPNGLLAAGGALDAPTLLAAYRRGIFPWYEAPQPVLWWTPDPRAVLFPEELHISRSLRRTLRRQRFKLSTDRAFGEVMRACAEPRAAADSTWIDGAMCRAYGELHRLGWAHSVEVWEQNALVGGLYGVCMGGVFFGESMFSRASDASKVALVTLVRILQERDARLIDCQVETAHMNRLGARQIPRVDFEKRLAQTVDQGARRVSWRLPLNCGELV